MKQDKRLFITPNQALWVPPPCPILKIEKSSLILQKILLILEKKWFVCVHIYGLNSHKKAVCWVSRTKNTIFSPVAPFFVCRTWGVYWSFYFYLLYFSIRILFHRHWRFTGQQGKVGDHLLLYSTTSSRSSTLRHLFATLHVRWQSRIFDRNACVYQTYHLIELSFDWLIDWWWNVCLFTWWIDSRFLFQRFDMAKRWISTRIDYHPCITSEPTNQVC